MAEPPAAPPAAPPATRSAPAPGTALALLGGQAFALGAMLAWITVPGNALFLERFGSGLLPVTYIGAAIAGAASSVLLGRALASRPLSRVVTVVLRATAIVLVGLWAVMGGGGADWISFAILVVLPIALPVGFMFVVGQAGMLLDVRVMKAAYPKVIAGFALGFTLGGLVSGPLIDVLGGTAHLLGAAAIAAAVLVALVVATLRRFPDELSAVDADDEPIPSPLATLRSSRFVLLITVFQMLSAVESQWLDYLVYDRAAARYPDTAELAGFVGRFSAIAYGTDIVFLLLVAGLLLRRFGLRLGLGANGAVVAALVVAAVGAGVAQGSGATIVFVLVVATRVADMALADGMTRTSVSAAYQALPHRRRLAAQTLVESLAVPVAIGISGVALLAVRATVGTSGPVLLVLTLPVLIGFLVTGLLIYAEYRDHLLENLRHRVLVPADLGLGTVATASVVDRLLSSDDPHDLRLGLEALATTDRPDRVERLERLAARPRPAVHARVMGELASLDPDRAIRRARTDLALEGPVDPVVVSTAIDVVGRAGVVDLRSAVVARLDDPDPTVRLAAASAVCRIGSDEERDRVGLAVRAAATGSASERVLAARVLGAVDSGSWRDPALVARLLDDDDPDVVAAALDAIRWPEDADAAEIALGLLGRRATSVGAADTLARGGDLALPLLASCLELGRYHRPRRQLLAVRAARDIASPAAVALLWAHAGHPDRDVGLAVLEALAEADPPRGDEERSERVSDVIADDLAHAANLEWARALLDPRAASGIETASDAGSPRRILAAALDDELRLVRRRVVAGLALQYGTEALRRVEHQLAQRSAQAEAMAMEWLETTVTGRDRVALAFLDPQRTLDARVGWAGRSFVAPVGSRDELLADLVADPADRWRRTWVGACALLVVAAESPELPDVPPPTRGGVDDLVAETLVQLARRRSVADADGPGAVAG